MRIIKNQTSKIRGAGLRKKDFLTDNKRRLLIVEAQLFVWKE